jgi:hypothetical protein
VCLASRSTLAAEALWVEIELDSHVEVSGWFGDALG